MRKIKIVAAIIAVTAMVGVSVAALIVNPATFQRQDSGVEEVEDCDAEDWINREADCGFVGPKPSKTSAVKVSPKPRTTVRR